MEFRRLGIAGTRRKTAAVTNIYGERFVKSAPLPSQSAFLFPGVSEP
jgi:hypothetical protein